VAAPATTGPTLDTADTHRWFPPTEKRVLDERLTEIGYETVMSAGLSLSRALLEHSPQFSDLPEYERARVLDQLQADHAFAFQKYDNAFPNLLATVKRATPVTSGKVRFATPTPLRSDPRPRR
jgi:hypothetical protein